MPRATNTKCLRWVAGLLLFAILALPARATLIESWENTGLAGAGNCQGPWTRMKEAPKDLRIDFSREHATYGDYCLAIYTPGGIVQALSNTVNFTDAVKNRSLRQVLGSSIILSFDVYVEKSMGDTRINLNFLGSNMRQTQVIGDTLHPGKNVARFTIDQTLSAALRSDDDWFQFFFTIESSGPGTVYLDYLRIE